MKKTILASFLLLPLLAAAKIWTLDNSPGSGAHFTTFTAAHSAASAGDTIIIMPSFTNYGNIALSKRLFVYSGGYLNNSIDKDKKASVSSVNFTTGSDSSVMQGLNITAYSDISSNKTILRYCLIERGLNIGNVSNVLVTGNVFTYFTTIFSFSSNYYIGLSASANYCVISHNYFSLDVKSGSETGTRKFVVGGNSTNLFTNNMIAEIQNGGTIVSGGFRFFESSYMKVENNILWSNAPNRSKFDTLNSGSTFRNNITYSATNTVDTLPGFNYNDTMPLFEGGYDNAKPPVYSVTNDMRLKAGSIGKNGGTDSTDVGLYGQSFPVNLSGYAPGSSSFTDFQILNPVIKKGQTLKVRVKGRKENE